MKRLLLVRHAKSDWSDDSLRDYDRPLNKRGKHDAPRMAKFLAAQKVVPTHFLSSPANRAYSTARLFADELGIAENDIATDEALYEAFTQEILSAACSLPDQHDIAAIFSHNPSLTSAVAQFSENYISNVPTCGIGYIEARVNSWKDFTPKTAALRELWLPKEVLKAYA